MNARNRRTFVIIVVVLTALTILLSSCAPRPTIAPSLPSIATVTPTDTPQPTATPRTPTRKPDVTPTVTPVPLPALSLHPGDFYFSLDGTQRMVYARNPTAPTAEDFSLLLDWARQGGTKFLRIHITMGWDATPWSTTTGAVNETWAQKWDGFFDQAEADGIWIMPVFGVWFQWNGGAPDLGSGTGAWRYNPYNQANGGPFSDPGELFLPDSPAQQTWLKWVKTLVERWQRRNNIAAWEIFSEINNASGAPGHAGVNGAVAEPLAEDFTNRLVTMIHAVDTKHRPVTVSGPSLPVGSPGTDQAWEKFYDLPVLDFIEVHPYSAQLDREIIAEVHNNLQLHNKPVLNGESGLWEDTAIQPNSWIGVRHAIWAGVVSGAATARALWSNDGGAFYSGTRPMAVQYMEVDATAELAAARFTEGVDFSGFKPLPSISSPAVWGAAVGNESMVLGWFRDADSEATDWVVRQIPAGNRVTITVPGRAANWQVDFYDTSTGRTILSSTSVTRQGSTVTVTLPGFQDNIAFKMMGGAEISAITPEVVVNTNEIAGKWSGTITNTAGTFSTSVKLSIQAGCQPGKVCGTFAAPQVPCAGDLLLQTINGETFLFLEQNASGAASCKSGGYEQLQLLAVGTLSYEYLTTPGSVATSTGILKNP